MASTVAPSTRLVVLRPDAKGRVGLESLLKRSRELLGGASIAGLTAKVRPDGSIVLRPRVEVGAREANVRLSAADADRFVRALERPPKASPHLLKARARWRKDVSSL
jgi:Protein of unknown function (DUF1778)